MRVLRTGGARFIGSHLAEHLLARGHEVAMVADFSTGKRENVPDNAVLYETNIRFGRSLESIFREFRPEALAHQAAQMDVRRSVQEPDYDADVNVVGTVRRLQNCEEHGVGRGVFAPTGGAIYEEQEKFPAPEKHPQYSISLYSVSKLAGERYLHYYSIRYGISAVALR